MRAKTSRMKRCLSLLLAAVLMVPAMSFSAFANESDHIHNHAETDQLLSQLIVSNYGDIIVNEDYQQITAVEKVILNSDALVTNPEFTVDTELGTGNVTLNAVDMSITAKVVEDTDNNCVWTPVSAGVYVDGVEKEQVALTSDGAGNYVGNYTFDGSAFYVVVNYQLVKSLTDNERQSIVDLLNIAYELKLDLDVINLLVADASIALLGDDDDTKRTPLNVLNALTDASVGSVMGLEDGDTIIDLLYKLSKDGGMSQSFDLPFGSYEIPIAMRDDNRGADARAAAEDLKAQQDANGGKLDLTKFFADHSLNSYLEIVGKHADDLDTLLADLYADLGNANGSRGLGYAIDDLDYAINETVPQMKKDAIDWINGELDAMIAEYPDAGITKITSLDDLTDVIDNLQAERDGMVNLINKSLTQFNEKYPNAGLPTKVSTVAEMEDLKVQLEGIYSAALTAAGVTTKAELEAQVAQLTALGQTAAAAALQEKVDDLTALENAIDALGEAITALPQFDEAIANMKEATSVSDTDALQDTYNALVLLNEVLEATCDALEPVVDNAGLWNTSTYIYSDDSTVYASIMTALNEAAKADIIRLYTLDDVAYNLVIAEATDQANMSMSDITITIELNVVNAANSYYTHSLKKVITLEDGTTADELEPAVLSFANEAVAQWTSAGTFVAGKYVCADIELPDEVDGATEVVVTYYPIKVNVTEYGVASQVDYGTTITLPVHSDSTKAYDYLVNNVHYMQGSSIVVKDTTVITREEGEGYDAEKLFPIVSTRFDDYLAVIATSTANASDAIARVKNIITSGALGIENTNIYVRRPKNCVAISEGTGENDYVVTAQPYEAVYNGADWLPVSTTVYYTDGTNSVITNSTLVDGAYQFTFATNTLDHVEVNYELALADIGYDDEFMKTTMNEIMEVYNDVVDQLTDMQNLVSKLDYLTALNSNTLPTVKDLAGKQETKDAIQYLIECRLGSDGRLLLVPYLEDYSDVTAAENGLRYYYNNFEAIDAELAALKPAMQLIKEDEELQAALEKDYPSIAPKVDAVVEQITAIELTGPDENLNNIGLDKLLTALSNPMSSDTYTELPYLEDDDALPGDKLVLTESLTLAGPGDVQVVIKVTTYDELTSTTVVESTTPITLNAGGALTDEQIANLLETIATLKNGTYKRFESVDNPNTEAVEPTYSADALEVLLSGEKDEDLVISYYWIKRHTCAFTDPTCTQAPYCIYCGAVKGEPDTSDAGHTWDEGVVSLAPTCEKTGLTLFTCAECEGTKTEEIAALGHVYGDYTSDNDVTCSTLGHKTAYCTREGCNVYDRVVDEDTPLLPHDLSGWSKVDGGIYHTRSCHDCTYSETNAHNWDAKGTVYKENAPTCTTDGLRTFTCSDCGETKTEVEPAIGHDFDYDDSDTTWVRSDAGHARPCKNGCGATGETHAHTFPDTPCDEKSSCEVCGYIKAAGTHKWDKWEKVDDDTHQRTCPECDDSETADHNWNDGVVTTAPTCTTKGEKTYTCNDCGATYTEEVAATGHSYSAVVTAPTCTTKGYTTFTCSCGDSYTADSVDATGHTYGDWTVTTKPTCTEKGEQSRFCPTCRTYETAEVAATGHSYSTVVTEPTCTTKGYTTYTCDCGDSYVSDYVDKTEHDYGDWYETVAPSCSEKGEKRRDCNDCDAFETAEIPATGHSYSTVVTEPTCTEKGYTTYTCDCGDSYVSDYVDANGHEYGDWYVTTESTCTEYGEQRRDCKHCDAYETAQIAMVDHDFTSRIYSMTDDGHHEKCKNCTTYGPEVAHKWSSDDCEATNANCTVCGYDKPAGSHNWSDWTSDGNDTHSRYCLSVCGVANQTQAHSPKNDGVVTTDPTCSVPGVRTHTCQYCGANYTVEIPATGIHVYDETQDPVVVTNPTCEVNGEGYYPCTDGCDTKKTVVIPAIGHSWNDGVVTTEPGCETLGVKTYTCQNDAAHTYTEDVAALGHNHTVTGNYTDDAHEVYCSRCETTTTVDHEWVEDGEAQNGIQDYKCACGATKTENIKPEIPDADDYVVSNVNDIVTVELPDNGGNNQYAMQYTITLGDITYVDANGVTQTETITITTTVADTQTGTQSITVNEILVRDYPEIFSDSDVLADFLWDNYQSFTFDCVVVDTKEAGLVEFVSTLDNEAGNSMDFSLVQTEDGSYSVIANVSEASSIQGAIMNVAMALVTKSVYPTIKLKTVGADGNDTWATLLAGGELSVQALIDGFLYEDGFGTGTIVNSFTSTGAINPDAVLKYDTYLVGSNAEVGAPMQVIYMALADKDGNVAYEVEFYVTLSQGIAQLGSIRDALEQIDPLLSAETKNGKMQLTLKEKFYEIYQAEMLMTGVADKNDPALATNEAACKYLYDYLTVLMGDKVTTTTYENTLALVGKNIDLSAYANVINPIIKEFGKAKLSTDCLTVTLTRNGNATVSTLLNKAGIAVNETLLGAIKEYKYSDLDLTFAMTAAFEPEQIEFEAVIIDPYHANTIDKFDFVTPGTVATRVNKLGSTAVVMLLDDIDGDLVFTNTAILDLNGKTVTGNIRSTGTLIIIDSCNGTFDSGSVTGTLSGNIHVVAGKFSADVEDYLAEGYVQNEEGYVYNVLYTVEEEEGNLTVKINSDYIDEIDGYLPSVRELAADIAGDLMLNYFTTASMSVKGEDATYNLYAVELLDALEKLGASNSLADTAISELVQYIDVDHGVEGFINMVLADLLDFATIRDALASDPTGAVAVYEVVTEPWDIELTHNSEDDYLTMNLLHNSDLVEEFTLSLVFDGDNVKTVLLPLVTELAEVVNADETGVTVELEQPAYSDKVLTNVTGSVTANADVDLSNNTDYAIMIGVILAYGNADRADAFVDAINAYDETGKLTSLKAAFDATTVEEVFNAFKALSRNVNFTAMVAAIEADTDKSVAITDTVAALESAYHLYLCAVGKGLEVADINGYTNKTMAGLAGEGGIYDLSVLTRTRSGSTSASGYGLVYDLTVNDSSLTVALFPATYTVSYEYTGTVPAGAESLLPADRDYLAGTNVTVADPVTLTNYGFSGWTTTDVTVTNGSFTMPEGNVTFTASWIPGKFNVNLPTGAGFVATAATGFSSPVTLGDSFTFTVAIQDGYVAGDNFAVKVNGTALTADSVNGKTYTYTISNISEHKTVTVEGVVPTHTVTLPTGTTSKGYTVTAVDGYDLTVVDGKEFKFTVSILNGYKAGANFAVKANGVKLTAVDGVYTITNITEDMTITVTGVEKIPDEQPETHTVTLPDVEETEELGYKVEFVTGYDDTVTDGSKVKFIVTILDGFEVGDDFAVLVNGEKVTPVKVNGNVYTFEITNVQEDLVITVVGVEKETSNEPTEWTVTLTKGTGYTFSADLNGDGDFKDSGESEKDSYQVTVQNGDSFSFKVNTDGNYVVSKVVANKKTLTPKGGVYTIDSITADVTVTVVVILRPVIGPTQPDPVCSCCCGSSCQGGTECKCNDGCPSAAYTDLNTTSWYHEYTDYVICRGLMIGISSDLFAPEMLTSRAMIVTVLYRLENTPEITGNATDYYTDVKDGTWYSDALVWATQNNLVLGYGNGLFGPNDVLTREQMATLFMRFAKWKGYNVEASKDLVALFQDAGDVSSWAQAGMEWAVDAGLINGVSADTLAPRGDIRRCDFATLMTRWTLGEFTKD